MNPISQPRSPKAIAFAQEVSRQFEAIAREQAAAVGFDIAKEPHGLFRAFMQAMKDPENMREAAKRAREKLESTGGDG